MMKVVPVLAQPVDRFLDARLGLDVERAGRLVEHQDRRVLQDSAGERDALALAARKLAAALAGRRVVAFALGEDEFVRRGGFRRRMHFVVHRAGAPDADVFLDRAVEQAGVLEHGRDRLAQRLLRHAADVDAVDQDAAVLRRMHTLQEVDERRLAGAGRPDDGDRLAGLHLEGNVRDALPGIRELERDVLEANVTGRPGRVRASRPAPASERNRPRACRSPRASPAPRISG